MPRDSSGNYTLPIENPVVDGTVITSDWANNTLNDIALQLNNVVTRDGVLGMVGPFKFIDGTVAAPSITFNSEPTLGFYREQAGWLSLARGGVKVADFTEFGLGLVGVAGKDERVVISKAASGTNAFIAGATNKVPRWAVMLGDLAAETGANAGSNFRISRYADVGSAPIGTVMLAERSTGTVYIGNENSDNALTVVQRDYGGGSLGHEAMLRSVVGSAALIADAKAGGNVASTLYKKGTLNRWSVFCSNAAETGGNAGSAFGIARCDDAGAQIDIPLTINRQTGIVTIKTSLSALELESGTLADEINALKARIETLEGLL